MSFILKKGENIIRYLDKSINQSNIIEFKIIGYIMKLKIKI